MSIPRKVREEAAMICAIAASSNSRHRTVGTYAVCEHLGITQTGEADDLITAAFEVALSRWQRWLGKHRRPIVVFAEVEAMLRCGWSPGDEP
jgi:hypothetical protein